MGIGIKTILNEKFPNQEARIDELLLENFSLLYSKLQTKSEGSFVDFLASKIETFKQAMPSETTIVQHSIVPFNKSSNSL